MAKTCKVCKKPYADDLDACPHCAEAAAEQDPDVDLSELFGEGGEEKAAEPPPEKKPPRKAPPTMQAVNLDDDEVDLGREDASKAPGMRTRTQLISPEEMDAVARGEEPDQPSILDSQSGLDVTPDPGIDASAVDLGADDNLNSEVSLGSGAFPGPGVDQPTQEQAAAQEEELPVVEHAVDEEELPVVESAAEEDEPEEKPKKVRGGKSWVYGAAGMVVGSALTILLTIFGLLPIDTGEKPAARPNPAPMPAPAPVQQAPVAAAVAPEQYLASGDFGKAVEAFGAQDTQDPAVLVKRGQARWLQYLQEKKQANAPLKKDDEAVAQAVKDLTDAKNAEGTLWLGLIEESVSGPAAARKVYQDGATKYPAEQRLFQAALDRVDATAAAGQRTSMHPADIGLLLAALTITLQDQPAAAPQQAQPAQPPADAAAPATPAKPVEEVGTEFWKAARLAKEQKYAEAVAALAQARTTHDKLRFQRLYKAQNPVTDPTEMIFLRTCDELTAYWQMCQALSQSGYLAQGKAPAQALNAALAAIKDAQGAGNAVAGLAQILKKDKDVTAADPEVKDVPKAIETLLASKQKTDDQLVALRAALVEGKYVSDTQKDLAAGLKNLLDEKKAATDALAAANQALKADGNLAQGIAKLQAEQKASAEKAAQAEKRLASTESALKEAAKQLEDIKYAQSKQGRTQAPHQMMEIWLPLLAEARGPVNRSLAETAQRDARQVANDAAADNAARGRALAIEGLAFRSLGRFDDSRQALKKALDADKTPPTPGDWKFTAKQALQALSDPNTYYVPEARRLAAQGKLDQALSRLEEALQVFPKTTPAGGAVLAERSAVRLAQAQAQGGSLNPSDPRLVEAIRDAKDAVAAGAPADGNYALGRCQEALGRIAEARQAYEQALSAHSELDTDGGKYRVALARLLVQMYGPKIPGRSAGRTGLWDPQAAFVAMMTLTQYIEGEPRSSPELDRAVQLADEAIRAGNAEGYLIKALALAGQKRWTDAVLEYSTGLEKLSGSPEQGRVLRYLMENHPSLRVPDGKQPPDVQAAERYFDQGLRLYWSQRYADAEQQFAQAIRNYDQDARYLYFLGLAQLAQDRRDQAAETFRKAGQLEQQGRPQSALVSAALERVQGTPRRTLNRYRP